MPRNSPVVDVLYRLKRGLAGYVSYLAACEMNESFSEYVLYEPTLRILTASNFEVRCECPCPGYTNQGRGDHKKIDFVAEGRGARFAIEMKWIRNNRLVLDNDQEKLVKFCEADPNARAFLFVFGTKSNIEHAVVQKPLKEQGRAVYAEFGVTKYGCRNFEILT